MYLNLIQIAESFGVSEGVVEHWIRDEGLPHTADRGRLLFDRGQVAQWAANRGLAAQVGFLGLEAPAFATGCRLEPLLRAGGIWRDVSAADLPGVFEKIIGALPAVTPPVRHLLSQRLKSPGGITWAPIGSGVALPHPSARIALGRDSGTLALIFLRNSVPLADPSPDGVPITRIFFFIAPSPRAHLDLLARLSRMLARGAVREWVMGGGSDKELFQALALLDASAATSHPEVKP